MQPICRPPPLCSQDNLTVSSWRCTCLIKDGSIVSSSGVNGGAGITPQNFADQFRVSSTARAALNSGQIILAPDANTTIENALETACWLHNQPGVHDIVLITGLSHMPRASWALESALAGSVSVRRLSPDIPRAGDARSRANMYELLKFGVTVLLTLMPRHLWPGVRPNSCM